MSKRNTRAFAFGIIVSVLIISTYFFIVKKEPAEEVLTEKTAKQLLEVKGYYVLTDEEHASLLEKEQTETKDTEPADETETESNIESETEQIEEPAAKTIILQISSGMKLDEIADTLEKFEIINSRDEFIAYMVENNYSTKLQLGDFEINAKMSHEEIAKIITKS